MSLLNNPLVIAGIVVVAVAYVLIKRSIGEPLNLRDLLVPPLVLIILGVRELTTVTGLTAGDLGWLAATLVVGAACGGVRAGAIRLYHRDGVLWQRYTRRTFIIWPLSVLVSGAFGFLATAAGMSDDARSVMLSIGVSLAGEGIVAGVRGMLTGGRFATESRDSATVHRVVFAEAAQRLRSVRPQSTSRYESHDRP